MKPKTYVFPVNHPGLLSRTQLAKRLGVSMWTILTYEQKGVIHPIRFGRKVIRFRLSEIERMEKEALGT